MSSSPKIYFIIRHQSFGTILENQAIFGFFECSNTGVLFLSPDATCTGALKNSQKNSPILNIRNSPHPNSLHPSSPHVNCPHSKSSTFQIVLISHIY